MGDEPAEVARGAGNAEGNREFTSAVNAWEGEGSGCQRQKRESKRESERTNGARIGTLAVFDGLDGLKLMAVTVNGKGRRSTESHLDSARK
jgi:hypothetical protein